MSHEFWAVFQMGFGQGLLTCPSKDQTVLTLALSKSSKCNDLFPFISVFVLLLYTDQKSIFLKFNFDS